MSKTQTPREAKRLKTESNESAEFFDPNMSARERKKLIAAMSLFGGGKAALQNSDASTNVASTSSKRVMRLNTDDEDRPSKTKKQKAVDSLQRLIDEDKLQIIEEILSKRVVDGKSVYLCRWKGFAPSFDSWEPAENIFCQQVIDDFEVEWAKAGVDCAKLFKRQSTSTVPSASASPTFDQKTCPNCTDVATETFVCYVCENVMFCDNCKDEDDNLERAKLQSNQLICSDCL
eukprot:m.271616 g.271616  ORF g.271616 m.271616 type:complete len:232 (-) comp96718_c0_seq1:4-699(-)